MAMAIDSTIPHSSSSKDESEYGADFTAEEEELLVALLNDYNARRADLNSGTTENLSSNGADAAAGNGLTVREHGPDALAASATQSSQQSMRSLLSFASSSALVELLDNASFPAAVQLGVPRQKSPSPSPTDDLPKDAATTVGDEVAALNLTTAPQNHVGPDGVSQQLQRDSATPPRNVDSSLPPIVRWRSHKALSVTDLVSPAWCELQYSLSLTHHGRKRRTPAMKQGSKVHQRLEDEVHATFRVAVMSKEDAWALRLWNIIQGSRTLRETGLTRELEVWGVVHDRLVTGIIDKLSYECPDEDLERQSTVQGKTAAGQQTIQEFFEKKRAGKASDEIQSKDVGSKVYLTDVKTRTVRSLPRGVTFRPTAMQLMLYHKMLAELTAGRFDPQRLWDCYSIDPDAKFSKEFVAQFAEEVVDTPNSSQSQDAQVRAGQPSISSSLPSTAHTEESAILGSEASVMDSDVTEPTHLTESLEDLYTILHEHDTLRSLWDLMLAELAAGFPDGLGTALTAEYRAQSDKSEVLGSKSFLFDEQVLGEYLGKTMQWWLGERKAEGVGIEEAWKCGSCEFSDGCEWRKAKVQEAVIRFREKNPATRKTK